MFIYRLTPSARSAYALGPERRSPSLAMIAPAMVYNGARRPLARQAAVQLLPASDQSGEAQRVS